MPALGAERRCSELAVHVVETGRRRWRWARAVRVHVHGRDRVPVPGCERVETGRRALALVLWLAARVVETWCWCWAPGAGAGAGALAARVVETGRRRPVETGCCELAARGDWAPVRNFGCARGGDRVPGAGRWSWAP